MAARIYKPTLTNAEVKTLLEDGPVKVASLDDLEHLAPRLEKLDEWVHTMEVWELRDDREIGQIDVAIMGLDGEDDWDIPLEPKRMRLILLDKIAKMRASGKSYRMELWMGEFSD